ncbi:feruloyl CoA ortho-hydroxylase 1-like protein [Tanacetum coccineum]
MAPSISITSTESLNIMDFVVSKGHGVKGLAELGLKALPNQYIQPPQERFDSSNEEPNQDSIPVIDMSNWDDPNVAKDICDAASKWGFFQIVNHGVPYHVLDDVKDATRKFFALPAEEKLKYSKEKSVTNSIRFGTSFSPEAEKALEWKDYLSLFFVSDDEIETLWPSACSRNQALEYIKSSELVFKKLLMM